MAGIDKIFSLGKGLLMKNADDLLKVRPQEKIEVFKDLVVKQADGMTLWSALDKNAPRVHQSPGTILRNARVLKSVNEEKFIDEMLDTARTEQVSARMKEIAEKKFGYVNPKRVLQAKEGFERGVKWTEPTPVKLESRYTKDVIEDMYGARMKAADDYLRAESLGTSLPEAVMKRREDAFEAFSKHVPNAPDEKFINVASRAFKETFMDAEAGSGKVSAAEALEAYSKQGIVFSGHSVRTMKTIVDESLRLGLVDKSLDVTAALKYLTTMPKGREYNNARCELIKMIDKVRKSGGEIKVSKHVVEAAEIDEALTARITKFIDGPMGRFEDLDQAIVKRFGLEL